MIRKIIITLFLFCYSLGLTAASNDTVRVLAIGNSFSVDAVEQELHAIATAGNRQIVIGNLYHPGCSVERHFNNISGDIADYSYRKISPDGRADTIADCTIARAIADDDWDYITFQQASHFSGEYESFEHLPELISAVRAAAGPKPVFLWHMTWAYAPDSDHGGFVKYDRDQLKMYQSIVSCAERVLTDNPELKGIIPCGTAIQDARTSALGDDLTRDGYHLDYRLGRYIASCTWYAVLFGVPAEGNSYAPPRVNAEQRRIAQLAADTAITHPFEITDIR